MRGSCDRALTLIPMDEIKSELQPVLHGDIRYPVPPSVSGHPGSAGTCAHSGSLVNTLIFLNLLPGTKRALEGLCDRIGRISHTAFASLLLGARNQNLAPKAESRGYLVRQHYKLSQAGCSRLWQACWQQLRKLKDCGGFPHTEQPVGFLTLKAGKPQLEKKTPTLLLSREREGIQGLSADISGGTEA